MHTIVRVHRFGKMYVFTRRPSHIFIIAIVADALSAVTMTMTMASCAFAPKSHTLSWNQSACLGTKHSGDNLTISYLLVSYDGHWCGRVRSERVTVWPTLHQQNVCSVSWRGVNVIKHTKPQNISICHRLDCYYHRFGCDVCSRARSRKSAIGDTLACMCDERCVHKWKCHKILIKS